MAKQAVTEEQLKAALEPITREVNDMRLELASMRKVVTGNGTGIGLDEHIRNNRRDIDRHEEQLRGITVLAKQVDVIENKVTFMTKITWFVLTIGGGYVIVEIVKFILNNI